MGESKIDGDYLKYVSTRIKPIKYDEPTNTNNSYVAEKLKEKMRLKNREDRRSYNLLRYTKLAKDGFGNRGTKDQAWFHKKMDTMYNNNKVYNRGSQPLFLAEKGADISFGDTDYKY